ncbi:amidohydrolase [Salinicoccus halitifaciens]|uniref:Amidohydrolase YtcJ n=1 Tax=Salinicoccus halitifaciens TaxID=1073415 RepID=A0ABV2EAW4_9STAP|nr:amidohydrolase [Salinicoccus halitifaciens]MCD2137580.1 amidohydrolase [Salinicoccus halitifaciens]
MKKLFYNGDIITMEGETETAEAVLIEDGLIRSVVEDGMDEYLNDPAVEKVDLGGRTLLPAFIDPHSHLAMMGPTSLLADLKGCRNFTDIQDTLTAYIKDNDIGKGEKVVGFGYDPNFMDEQAHPTKDVLNAVSTEHPIMITHASGHMGAVNDYTLEMAGIDEDTPDTEGGLIGRIEGTREPNGYLEETPFMSLRRKVFSGTGGDPEEVLAIGEAAYIKNGITTVQDGATSTETIDLFKSYSNKFKVDVVMYPLVAENPEDLEANREMVGKYHNRVKIGGYKMFLDGSPQGKTAWMTEPYEGEGDYKGYPIYHDDEVKKYAETAIRAGVQLLTHCNGDAASDQLLKSYGAALEASDDPNKNALRPVMIHCQTARDDQLDQMAELAMIPSIFVSHTYYWGDVHLKNFGEKRGSRVSPARSAFDRGLAVNFHQDSPIVDPDMLHTIWCAVNRITRNGASIGPEQRVSVYEALQAVTINAAYAYFEEDRKGSIKEGKLADLVVLDANPLKVPKEEIKDIKVLETIKEGETIYKAEHASVR